MPTFSSFTFTLIKLRHTVYHLITSDMQLNVSVPAVSTSKAQGVTSSSHKVTQYNNTSCADRGAKCHLIWNSTPEEEKNQEQLKIMHITQAR